MEKQPIHFELTKPIKYSNGTGAEVECSFIDLREPTGRMTNTVCAIEGMIRSSMVRMSDDIMNEDDKARAAEAAQSAKETEGGEKMDGDTVLQLITSSGVDMSKLVLHFRELFKEVAWMGAEKKITATRLDEMSHSDLRRMIGEYTAVFILN